MIIKITGYNALCNLGNSIDAIYEKAINGDITCFDNLDGYFKENFVRAGIIKSELPEISDENFNLRCNRLILKNLELVRDKINEVCKKFSNDKIAVVGATTNSGVREFENSKNPKHYELGNPAYFLHKYLGLNGFYTTVSTACSSGLKAFSLSRDLLNNNIADAVIVVCTEPMTKVPLYGFNSLEVLSDKQSIPFSKNRSGMNIGEACAVFIVEKNSADGIEIMGIGENTDTYHPTTPNPEGSEAICAIKSALSDAKIKAEDIDYINAHGTGTSANDTMEANAVFKVFGAETPISSTKPLTGHCLGSAAGIETALCCKLLDSFDGRLYPNVFDGEYDLSLPKINLVQKNKIYKKCNICMCNSFGFGGTNAIIILGKRNG